MSVSHLVAFKTSVSVIVMKVLNAHVIAFDMRSITIVTVSDLRMFSALLPQTAMLALSGEAAKYAGEV